MKKIIAILVVLIAGLTQVLGQGVPIYDAPNGVITGDVHIPVKGFELNKDLIIEGDLFLTGNLNIKKAILVVKGVIKNANSGYKISVQTDDGIIAILGFIDAHNKVAEEATDYKNGDFIIYKQNGKGETNKPENAYIENGRYNSEKALKAAEDLMNKKSQFLPIELTYFTVSQKGQDIVFEWETASETNNDFFTIEYSIDGINFHELTTIAGSGTTSEATSYNYVWNADESGLFYFRLKQTDYNGEFSYSKVVALNFDKETIQGIYFQNGKIMYNGNPLRL